jgi:pyrimidine deaminase RibD-like protein
MSRWLALALKVADASDHPHHHLGCVVVKGGAVLSYAANLGRRGRCAERRALRPHHDLRGAVAYVARSNGGTSRPCKHCAIALREAGVAFVVFVDEQRQVVREAVA